ncbi:MAG: PDZ domain-containing protein [Deltaproteobacteria bacterium]|nr:PDZ domain-containing protein [Deltaproteobacteria bacterium]
MRSIDIKGPLLRGINVVALRLKATNPQRLFILCAIVLFMFQGAGIFYKVLGLRLVVQPSVTPNPATMSAVLQAPPKEGQDYYRIVSERNLFGSTDKTLADDLTKQQMKSESAQPITALLELRGTVAGIGKLSFAVIEEKGKNKQGLYRIGDKIAGATLARIVRDQVVLKLGDKEETLKKRDAAETAIVPPVSADAQAAAGTAGALTLDRSDIAATLQNIGQVMRQAQIRPYFHRGMPSGFMVSRIHQGSIYQKMGLVDGDVIQEINDQKIASADDVVGLYNTLKSGSTLSVKIKRAGRQETMNYQFK